MLRQIKHKINIAVLLLLVFYTGLANRPGSGGQIVVPERDSLQHDTTVVIKKFRQTGIASYYAGKFHGRRTASGERYSRHKLTAAHRTLPFGTLVKVTDAKTGKWLIVRINDRGPHNYKRIIDLSYEAARQLGMVKGKGLLKVRIRVVEWPKDTEVYPQP
jgi:rare lipoprotein A